MANPLILLLPLLVLLLTRGRTPPRPGPRQFAACLTGAEEVPPVTTAATGETLLRLNDAETELAFELRIQRIEGATEAHIHLGAAGTNGPVVAFLFGPVPRGITVDSLLLRGTVTAADLVGPLAGASFATFVQELRQGNTYVNVHTLSHPEGEIRGQIQALTQEG